MQLPKMESTISEALYNDTAPRPRLGTLSLAQVSIILLLLLWYPSGVIAYIVLWLKEALLGRCYERCLATV